MKLLSSTSYIYRLDQMGNPLQVPLLAGIADVYVDGEYILSTNIATVPTKGHMELEGLSKPSKSPGT